MEDGSRPKKNKVCLKKKKDRKKRKQGKMEGKEGAKKKKRKGKRRNKVLPHIEEKLVTTGNNRIIDDKLIKYKEEKE